MNIYKQKAIDRNILTNLTRMYQDLQQHEKYDAVRRFDAALYYIDYAADSSIISKEVAHDLKNQIRESYISNLKN